MRLLLSTLILGFGLAGHSIELRAEFSGHVSIVNSVVFSANGKTALSGSWDWTMCLWDVASQNRFVNLKLIL